MLSSEGYRDRRWGWLPVLRVPLENKPELDGRLTSIDDTAHEAFARYLSIATLAIAHRFSVRETALQLGREEMHRDIERLETALRGAAQVFEKAAQEVSELHQVVEER